MTWRNKFSKTVGDSAPGTLRAMRERDARARGEELEAEAELKRAAEDRTPIPPQHWIENEYFSGSFAATMYPGLKEHFVDIVERGISLVLLHGAQRWGKTVMATALQGRSTYETSLDSKPQRKFGLMDESILLYLNMNVTDKKAHDAYFTKFSTWVRSTPYFIREFAPQPHVINQLRFPKHILAKYSGALSTAAESEDLFFYVGDEVNKYDVVERSKRARSGDKYDAAAEIETAVSRRMQGTFMRQDGTYPSACKVIWLCSETYPESFTCRKDAEIVREDLEARGLAKVIESTEWGFKPRPKDISYFFIRTASRTQSARIIDDRMEAEGERSKLIDLEERGAPGDEMYRIIDVPDTRDYRAEAGRNLEMFVRDMCGVPTEAISMFFREREPIFAAVRKPGDPMPGGKGKIPASVCVHPMTAEVTDTVDGVRFLQERLVELVKTGKVAVDPKTREETDETILQPIINPGEPRYGGIDAGLTGDPCGLAAGHRCGWKTVIRRDEDNKPVEELAPHIWVDLALRIMPPPGGQIPFAGIRAVFYSLAGMGFGIAKITCDSFQHVAITQPLEGRGYPVEVVSVAATPDAYNMVQLAYMEGRINAYSSPQLEGELVGLERIVTGEVRRGRPVEKIHHRPGGTCDVTDALAQIVFQIELASKSASRAARMAGLVEPRGRDVDAERHVKEWTREDAFRRGDFESMHEMEEIDKEEDW